MTKLTFWVSINAKICIYMVFNQLCFGADPRGQAAIETVNMNGKFQYCAEGDNLGEWLIALLYLTMMSWPSRLYIFHKHSIKSKQAFYHHCRIERKPATTELFTQIYSLWCPLTSVYQITKATMLVYQC